jgi:transcriptional regulator with XRE-family HTH domain
MDLAHALRAARRQAAMSQRALAGASGVSHTTISRLESGQQTAGWDVVERLARPLGLELALVPRRLAADDELRQWLTLPTSERLYRSLGGRGLGRRDQRHPTWQALRQLGLGHYVLPPESGIGVWLPDVPAPAPLPVLAVLDGVGRHGKRSGPELALQPGPWSDSGLVRVGVLPHRYVLVHPPDSPRLVDHPVHGPRLLAAAGLLHDEMSRDEQGRRRPAHRDSRPRDEWWWVYHRRRYDVRKEMPDEQRSRDWRLGGEASLWQWLAVRGHNVPDRPWDLEEDLEEDAEEGVDEGLDEHGG